MPKIAIYKAFTFLIVMFDTFGEPPHLHIAKTKSKKTKFAKIWLESLEFSEVADFTNKELNLIQKIVSENQPDLLNLFEKAKNGEKFKPLIIK